jgi:fatty acid desaturase
MSRRAERELRLELAREELLWRRDARRRANLGFAIRSAYAVIALVILVGSILFGWPLPHAVLPHLDGLTNGWLSP